MKNRILCYGPKVAAGVMPGTNAATPPLFFEEGDFCPIWSLSAGNPRKATPCYFRLLHSYFRLRSYFHLGALISAPFPLLFEIAAGFSGIACEGLSRLRLEGDRDFIFGVEL